MFSKLVVRVGCLDFRWRRLPWHAFLYWSPLFNAQKILFRDFHPSSRVQFANVAKSRGQSYAARFNDVEKCDPTQQQHDVLCRTPRSLHADCPERISPSTIANSKNKMKKTLLSRVLLQKYKKLCQVREINWANVIPSLDTSNEIKADRVKREKKGSGDLAWRRTVR